MRLTSLVLGVALAAGASAALAQPPPAPPAAAPTTGAAPAATTPSGHYTVADTDLGTLLDDPASKAILTQEMPAMISNPQIDMARGMTLKDLQQYSPDLTDAKLAKIDAELAALPPKK